MLNRYKTLQERLSICLKIIICANKSQAYSFFIFFTSFSLLSLLEPFALRNLINSFSSKEMSSLYMALAILLLLMFFKQIVGTIELLARTKLQDTIPYTFEKKLIDKALSLALTQIENPRIQDLIFKSKNLNLSKAMVNAYSLIVDSVSVFSIVLLFCWFGTPAIALITLIFAWIQLIIQVKQNKKVAKLISKQGGEYRLVESIFSQGINKEANMEIRVLLANKFLLNKFVQKMNILSSGLIKQEGIVARKKAIPFIIYIAIQVLMSFFIGWMAIVEGKSIGDFILLLTLFNLFNELLQGINFKLNTFIRDSHLASELNEFLNIPSSSKGYAIVDSNYLELKSVSYKYPSSTQFALKDINLKIINGQTIAIVGEIGSGKSTLAKVLSGLIHPEEGFINIKENKCSVVFQDFLRYQFTLENNIILGDINRVRNEQELLELLNFLDFNISMDLKQQLGTTFGGTDLSGGQWQKLAIARGLWKDQNVIIFDEPTSALDAKSELLLINKFLEATKEKTKIIVTHRLAAAKSADVIIVMDKGGIIETGKHEELISIVDGKYNMMFNSQAQWYTS